MAYELFYKYLYSLFSDGNLSFLRLFQYITFRSAYAAITALFLSLLLAVPIIRWLKKKKVEQPIRNDGPQTHLSKSGTPSMGGIIMLLSIVISVLFWGRLDFSFIILLLCATVAFGLIGFLDDYRKVSARNSKGISAKTKLLLQGSVSFVLALCVAQVSYWDALLQLPGDVVRLLENGVRVPLERVEGEVASFVLPLYVPFFDTPVLDLNVLSWSFYCPGILFPVLVPPVYLVFACLVIVGSSNAVNLTDGLDGLATGLLVFVAFAFGIIAYLTGTLSVTQYLNIVFVRQAGELAVFCSAFVGAAMGFLWYNSYPAKIFMGDTGALSLGSLIGLLALMMKKELLLLILGGVFVLEALSVIVQVVWLKVSGKRVFRMAPLHHHFELCGWHESALVVRFWILGAACAFIALSTFKTQ